MSTLQQAIAASPQVRGLAPSTPTAGLVRRCVRPAHVVAQSVAAVAPTAGVVTTPAILLAVAGPDALWAALISVGVILLVASQINQFTRRMAASGSLYTFVAKGRGPATAVATACSLAIGYAFVATASVVGSAGYLVQAVTGARGGAVALAVAAVAGSAVVGVLALRGVATAGRLLIVLEVLAIGVLALALVSVARAPGPHLSPSAMLPVPHDVVGIGAGVIFALATFVGFESSASLAPEARRPFAVIPRAVLWTAAGAGLLFIAAVAVQFDGFHSLGLDAASTATPLTDLVAAHDLTALVVPLDAAVGISFLACAAASVAALVRLLHAVATDGLLPPALTRTHPRFRTPWVAVAVVVPLVAAVAAVAVGSGLSPRSAMDLLLSISLIGYVLAYLLVCLAVPGFLRRIGERTRRADVGSAVAVAVLSVAVVTYVLSGVAAGRPAPAITVAALMSVGAVWFWRTRRQRPDRVRGIGLYDETTRADVLRPADDVAGTRSTQ